MIGIRRVAYGTSVDAAAGSAAVRLRVFTLPSSQMLVLGRTGNSDVVPLLPVLEDPDVLVKMLGAPVYDDTTILSTSRLSPSCIDLPVGVPCHGVVMLISNASVAQPSSGAGSEAEISPMCLSRIGCYLFHEPIALKQLGVDIEHVWRGAEMQRYRHSGMLARRMFASLADADGSRPLGLSGVLVRTVAAKMLLH